MKRFSILLILVTLLGACNAVKLSTTPTVVSTAALSLTPLPTSTQTPTAEPTFTPSSMADTALPDGWRLDEYPTGSSFENQYDGYILENYSFDINNRQFLPYGVRPASIWVDGHLIGVTYTAPKDSLRRIKVHRDGVTVYEKTCDPKKDNFWENLFAFFSFDHHWIVELNCEGQRDVIIDGQSMNQINGNSDSFGVYMVSGKLFYFYYRGNDVGFTYDGIDYPLDYEEILFHYCCGIAELNPYVLSDQIYFHAVRGGDGSYGDIYDYQYAVVLGDLDGP